MYIEIYYRISLIDKNVDFVAHKKRPQPEWVVRIQYFMEGKLAEYKLLLNIFS